MSKETKLFFGIIIGLIVIIGGLFIINSKTPGKYDAFAQCITNSGAKFYGAFWCPHCQAQKKLFGASAKDLPYVECSTPDGQAQLPICKEKNISSYPTWVFADGTISTGELTFEQLAEKTGCTAPVIGS
jgi:thiol-disulfide isomerase/thioredoxin